MLNVLKEETNQRVVLVDYSDLEWVIYLKKHTHTSRNKYVQFYIKLSGSKEGPGPGPLSVMWVITVVSRYNRAQVL